MEGTIAQLAQSLKGLNAEELADLEMLLDKDEMDRRSREVKAGDFLKLDDLNSLRDV